MDSQHFSSVGHSILKQSSQSPKYSGVGSPLTTDKSFVGKWQKKKASRIRAKLPSLKTFSDPGQNTQYLYNPDLSRETEFDNCSSHTT